uniref:Retrovirus-related Pol polyprotein from transposon TNT 1-94 n=1 Tax=Tanacetum cinerariifolium TaxID=118510 RepID=A0A6L2MDM0_TANCI|nr:retrovirus-related Pol polyprotein from transposon TNT 1-94 [Tanacetum cinerariifolium]
MHLFRSALAIFMRVPDARFSILLFVVLCDLSTCPEVLSMCRPQMKEMERNHEETTTTAAALISPCQEACDVAADIKAIHQRIHDKITNNNELLKYMRDKGRKHVLFQPGDLVWLHFRKERFPSKRRSKLSPRSDGPFKVLAKVNDNAYKLDLPGSRGATVSRIGKEFVQWKKAINEEMVSLEKNQTCSLVRLPARKKASQRLWMFKVKEEQGTRLNWWLRVSNRNGFSPVVKMTTIRLVLSIVASEDLHLEQLDVKTAFLYGDLDEDIYMTQTDGFQSNGKEENLVCKLKKSLYGLKQAPDNGT